MKKRFIILAVCLLVISVALVVWQYVIPAFRARTFYLAAVGPLSGKDAVRGEEMLKGMKLYLKLFRSDERLQNKDIQLLTFDDRSDEDTAARVAQEIANNNRILLVLGHLRSSTSFVAGNVYKREQIPAITASATTASVTQGDEWYFRMIPNNNIQAEFIAKYIRFGLNAKTVSIISEKGSYNSSVVQQFQKTARQVGLNMLKEWRVGVENADLEDQLKSISQGLQTFEDPGVIFLATSALEAAKLITMLRNAGKTYTFMGTDRLSNSAAFLNAFPQKLPVPGYYADGVYAISPFFKEIANEHAQIFRRAYLDAYREEPSWVAALYYDAMAVAVEAIARSENDLLGEEYIRSNRKKIRQTLAEFHDADYGITGITGNIYFDLNGDVNLPYSVGRYKQQQFLPAFTQYHVIDHFERDELLFERLLEGKIIRLNNQMMNQYQVIYTGILVHNITQIDLKNSRYALDFSLWFRFSAPENAQAQAPSSDFLPPHADIFFENAVTPIPLGRPVMVEHSNGEVLEFYRIQAEFTHNFDFHAYPFDVHIMPIRFYNKRLTKEILTYVQDTAGIPQALRLQPLKNDPPQKTLDGWKIKNIDMYQDVMRINSTLGNPQFFGTRYGIRYSRFITDIQIERENMSFAIKRFVPLLLVFAMLCGMYFAPSNWLGVQAACFIAALFITAQTHITLVSELPVDYLTLFEYALFIVYALIAIAMYISISAYVFYERRLALLQGISLFKSFSYKMDSTLSKKMRLQRIKRPAQKLVSQGDRGDSLFVIIEGEVSIWKHFEDGRYVELHRITTGGFFGEMALLTGEPRTADVISTTPVVLGKITKAHISPFLKKHPDLVRSLCEEVVQRTLLEIQKTSEDQTQLLDKDSLSAQYRLEIQQFFGLSEA